MTTIYQIEYLKDNDFEYLDVEFFAEVEIGNDSFSYAGTHCTGGRSGTFKTPDYLFIEDVQWDESLYSEEENQVIKDFLEVKRNRTSLEKQFLYEYEKESYG